MQNNWNKKKIEVTENNPHLAQLEYDLEYDKNKILIQSLKYKCLHSETWEKIYPISVL